MIRCLPSTALKKEIVVKKFMDKDFLLESKAAQRLYFDYAAQMPIFDYHCHLSPREIADNKRESDITSAWLGGDHYKWRMIRANGMDERDGDSFEKFLNWSDAVAHLIGNPLYHWTHLELRRYFGIDTLLSPVTAREIYDEANRKLKEDPELDVHGIFRKFNVYAVGTTDDPVDSLEFHVAARGKTETKVIPSFRPDKAVNIDAPGFCDYIGRLAKVSGISISSVSDLMAALAARLDLFVQNGCLASDHAVLFPPFAIASESAVNGIFKRVLSNGCGAGCISPLELEQFRTFVLLALGREYSKRGIVMQIHMQALRNNNSKGFAALGADTGYDAVADFSVASKLSSFLDALESDDALPRTILYSLNPADYYPLLSLMGCFQKKGVPGKLQLGSGWWFCDHIDGMRQQMKMLGNIGMLSRFVGMVTDSRSFLSYPRHEYFRRILCNLVGSWMECGEAPDDFSLAGRMVQDISFNNAAGYFSR